ncbi:MAG TPA: tetratricopeptide repeat protein [Bacteroidales bacterium]|nr:tetratricopeptide repeat protein [Bacteroidales bacterium]
MAKKNDENKGIQNIEVTLTKTEQWLEDNYKPLLYGLSVVIIIVGLFWLVKFMGDKRSKTAQSEMFAAEQYFAQDSMKLALNGGGNNLGFLDIIKTYGRTKSGKLAHYYAGVCYMHLGEYQNAIDHLKKYTLKDEVLAPEAIALTGDAYVELGQKEKGINLYLKAAEMADNNFHSPLYLMKAGEMYEVSGNLNKALEVYNKIKDQYPESTEGRSIDKYISRVKVLIK